MYIHTPWDIYVRQGDLEVSTRASGFGVDNVLRDTLAIEVREEIDMLEICDKSDKRDRWRRE